MRVNNKEENGLCKKTRTKDVLAERLFAWRNMEKDLIGKKKIKKNKKTIDIFLLVVYNTYVYRIYKKTQTKGQTT